MNEKNVSSSVLSVIIFKNQVSNSSGYKNELGIDMGHGLITSQKGMCQDLPGANPTRLPCDGPLKVAERGKEEALLNIILPCSRIAPYHNY